MYHHKLAAGLTKVQSIHTKTKRMYGVCVCLVGLSSHSDLRLIYVHHVSVWML